MINDLVTMNHRAYTKEKVINIRNLLTLYLHSDNIIRTNFTGIICRKYRGDIHGLLALADVPPILWQVMLEINGLRSSSDYTGKDNILLLNEQSCSALTS